MGSAPELRRVAGRAFAAGQLRWGLASWFERVGELHGIKLSLPDYHQVNGAARVRVRFVGLSAA